MKRTSLIILFICLTADCFGQAFMANRRKAFTTVNAPATYPLITSYTQSSFTRNNATVVVGGFWTNDTGGNVYITHIGRWVVSGNNQSHNLYITDTSGQSLGAVTLNTSGLDSGMFHYVQLGSEITVNNNGVVAILSSEREGFDMWWEFGGSLTLAIGKAGKSCYTFESSPPFSLADFVATEWWGPPTFRYRQ
jgi:hypothetical protein